MSRPNRPTYKTLNWPEYNKALKRRGSLTIWFDPGMAWAAKPTGKRGRQPVYSDAAVQTCLTMKVLFGMALRQTTGFVESLLCLVGLDWEVPDFSTLSRRQKTLAVNISHRTSQGPLHLLIDSTGIKVEGEGEWNARKHGGAKRRVWRKVHLGIDEQTLEIRAVEVTSSDVGDAPMLPELLSQIPPDQEIASVTADGAYDTRKCHDAIAERGADAVIPPRKNAKTSKVQQHRKALGYDEAATCVLAVKNSGAGMTTKLAFEFLVLTATRSGEVREAVWEEIDLERKVWQIPAERMKMKRPHRVPLSAPAVVVLELAKTLSDGKGFVFPGTKLGRPLSDMTISKLVKELGFNADVHGFRTSFRTWAQEKTSYPREVAEAALSHLSGDAVERAYARSDLFEKRREMMDAWARHLHLACIKQ